MARKEKIATDLSTEEKIKEAARTVFTKKGYAATRTRDIAEEAGINLALLNYYFRSKQKLFEEVMLEKVQQLFGVMAPIINNAATTLDEKLELIAINYITMLSKNPDLPIFVLSEFQKQTEPFKTVFPIENLIKHASFIQQLKEKRSDINPVHFLVNILAMCVFPFVARPAFSAMGIINDKGFEQLLEERKKLIPIWSKAMLKAK